jgi:predicted ATP-dependent endonuclease of OLD family
MPIAEASIENFTLFEKMQMQFSRGINVFIGDNDTGKTHLH